MDSGVKIIVDIKEAEKLFDSLDFKTQTNVLKSAIRNALAPITKQAQQNFANEFNSKGPAYESLGLQMFRKGLGGATGARIAKRAGMMINAKGKWQRNQWIGYYARWLDLGTGMRTTRKGASRGKLKPSLFFNSVAYSRQDKAMDDLSNSVIAILNKQIKAGKI